MPMRNVVLAHPMLRVELLWLNVAGWKKKK
jgi:hypothetical protein